VEVADLTIDTTTDTIRNTTTDTMKETIDTTSIIVVQIDRTTGTLRHQDISPNTTTRNTTSHQDMSSQENMVLTLLNKTINDLRGTNRKLTRRRECPSQHLTTDSLSSYLTFPPFLEVSLFIVIIVFHSQHYNASLESRPNRIPYQSSQPNNSTGFSEAPFVQQCLSLRFYFV